MARELFLPAPSPLLPALFLSLPYPHSSLPPSAYPNLFSPPSTHPLPITYTRYLLTLPIYLCPLPLLSLFPFRLLPIPAYSLPPSSYLPIPAPSSLFPFRPLPILSPLLLRTKGMRGTLSSLWEGGEAQGTLIFHSPLGGRARGEIGIKYPRRRTHFGVRRLGSTSREE